MSHIIFGKMLKIFHLRGVVSLHSSMQHVNKALEKHNSENPDKEPIVIKLFEDKSSDCVYMAIGYDLKKEIDKHADDENLLAESFEAPGSDLLDGTWIGCFFEDELRDALSGLTISYRDYEMIHNIKGDEFIPQPNNFDFEKHKESLCFNKDDGGKLSNTSAMSFIHEIFGSIGSWHLAPMGEGIFGSKPEAIDYIVNMPEYPIDLVVDMIEGHAETFRITDHSDGILLEHQDNSGSESRVISKISELEDAIKSMTDVIFDGKDHPVPLD